MSLIAVNKIRKEYRNKVVLADVSLQVERGERVALIGPNGSGKTTLLKIMMQMEPQDEGEVFRSKRVKTGYLSQYLLDLELEDVTALHYEELYLIEQRIEKLELKMSTLDYDNQPLVEETLKEYEKVMLAYEHLDGYNLQNKIKKILLGLGLKKEALSIPLNRLSGGEKMRVALARILINEPELLILDEPTNHLDIKAIEWLENFLIRFKGGVLIVSHDRFFLDKVSTRIAELQGGHLTTKKCNYTSYLEQKSRLKEFYLKEQKNIQRHIRSEKEMITKLRKYKKIKQSQSREKALKKYEEKAHEMMMHLKSSENLKHMNGPALTFKKLNHLSHEVVTTEKLNKYFDKYHLLKDIDMTIYGGERVAIIGPNGCGKTTLLNIMLEKDQDYTGFVRFGKWVDYAYLGQEVSFEDESRTMLEEIMLKQDYDEKEARQHLARFQFYGDVVNSKIEILSGGEKVRIILSLIMLNNPHCLILDEPTNHLDLESRIAIEKAIADYNGTVIAVSHDRYFLNQCIDRIIEIEDGTITDFDGNYDHYKNSMLKEVQKTSAKKKKSIQLTISSLEVEIESLEYTIDQCKQSNSDQKIIHAHQASLKHLYKTYEEKLETAQ